MEGFVRLNKTVQGYGKLIPIEEFQDHEKLSEYISEAPELDWYTSLFILGKEAKTQFDETKSVANYKGPAYCNNLVFDIDCKGNLEKAREDTDKLLYILSKECKLGKEGIRDHVRVYFSGNKGFHVFVKTSRQFTPEELKHYCTTIASELDSFDTVIYNSTRLFRIANTKHHESGLYKIPVSLDLIKKKGSTKQIVELAKEQQFLSDDTKPLNDLSYIDAYVKFKNDYIKPKNNKVLVVDEMDGIRGLTDIDFKRSKHTPKCIYGLSQGIMVPGQGERHHIFLHLGNFYRNQGHSPEVVKGILNGIAKLNYKLYPESDLFSDSEIENSVIKMAFSDDKKVNPGGWGVRPDDQIFAAYCKAMPSDHVCPIHDKKHKAIVKIEAVANDFANFAANFEDNVIPTGISTIDNHMKIAIGTTTLLVGSSGTGKTSLCLSAIEESSKRGMYSVFFSMDMHRNMLYQKLIQRCAAISQEDIFKAYKNRDIKKIEELKTIVQNSYKNTYLDFSGSLSFEDMKQRVELIEQEYGNKISLVVVDYASRAKGPYSDSNQNETYNAILSKDIADQTDAAWMILNQIARVSGDGSTALRTKRVAKGSSAWEESASNQINIWRPFMGLHEHLEEDSGQEFRDEYMRLFLAKNRMGKEIETLLKWDGYTGKVYDMDEEEMLEYNKNIKPLERKTFKYKK